MLQAKTEGQKQGFLLRLHLFQFSNLHMSTKSDLCVAKPVYLGCLCQDTGRTLTPSEWGQIVVVKCNYSSRKSVQVCTDWGVNLGLLAPPKQHWGRICPGRGVQVWAKPAVLAVLPGTALPCGCMGTVGMAQGLTLSYCPQRSNGLV